MAGTKSHCGGAGIRAWRAHVRDSGGDSQVHDLAARQTIFGRDIGFPTETVEKATRYRRQGRANVSEYAGQCIAMHIVNAPISDPGVGRPVVMVVLCGRRYHPARCDQQQPPCRRVRRPYWSECASCSGRSWLPGTARHGLCQGRGRAYTALGTAVSSVVLSWPPTAGCGPSEISSRASARLVSRLPDRLSRSITYAISDLGASLSCIHPLR